MAFKTRSKILPIRLTDEQYEALGVVADSADMKPATYAHALVMQAVKAHQSSTKSSRPRPQEPHGDPA
jgi:hypothetical protein